MKIARALGWGVLGITALVILLALTLAAFGFDVPASIQVIAKGAFGSKYGIANTLVRSCPLILCGLGIAVAWRGGMFNIGGEGQYLVGAVAGAYLYKVLGSSPSIIFQIASLLVGAAAGGLLAGFAAWLQIRRGVQVVISTILLNFIVLQFIEWSVRGPAQEKARALPLSDQLPRSMMLGRFDPQTDLHAGVLLLPLVAAVVFIWLLRSHAGLRLRLVGENPRAARANNIPIDRVQFRAMAVSGALCGLAGSVDYLGWIGNVGSGSAQNWGFLAIPVALLGSLNPVGILASGVCFGGLLAGCEALARSNSAGSTVVYVVQAAAVLGYVGISMWLKSRKPDFSEESA